jgi:hypothetical protein
LPVGMRSSTRRREAKSDMFAALAPKRLQSAPGSAKNISRSEQPSRRAASRMRSAPRARAGSRRRARHKAGDALAQVALELAHRDPHQRSRCARAIWRRIRRRARPACP